MNKFNFKIPKQEKKILVYAGITALAIILGWSIFYLPKRSTLVHLKKELADKEGQSRKIEQLIGAKGQLQDVLVNFGNKLKKLEDRFPTREETVIRTLNSIAREANFEILSLRPGEILPVERMQLDKAGLGGKQFSGLMLTVDARAPFRNLMNFLEKIENDLSAVITVDKMFLSKSKPSDLRLEIKMNLTLYLLTE